jgi:CheY-like chemotaxis protein
LPYGLAIIDWMMPDMNGVTLTQKIQASHNIEIKPVVIMATAYDKSELLNAADLAKIVLEGVVVKPLTPSSIFNNIMSALGHAQAPTEGTARSNDEPQVAIDNLKGASILLVEDNRLNQELAIELLQNHGIHVTLAENGQIALDILSNQTFDGVLMDCQMPIMDGYQATKEIRKQKRFCDLPIIAMTANVMVQDIEKAQLSGMNDHIGKPLDVHHMFQTMNKWIQVHAEDDTSSLLTDIEKEPTEIPDYKLANLVGIDTESGLRRTQGNLPLYIKLLKRFKKSTSNFEHEFNQAQDLSVAERLAHSLKGMAGNISADKLHQAAQKLEDSCKNDRQDPTKQAHLSQVLDELRPVLISLESVLDIETKGSSSFVTLSKEELHERLLHIKRLIEEYDTEAIGVLNDLLKQVDKSDVRQSLEAIESLINNYDFEAALNRVRA